MKTIPKLNLPWVIKSNPDFAILSVKRHEKSNWLIICVFKTFMAKFSNLCGSWLMFILVLKKTLNIWRNQCLRNFLVNYKFGCDVSHVHARELFLCPKTWLLILWERPKNTLSNITKLRVQENTMMDEQKNLFWCQKRKDKRHQEGYIVCRKNWFNSVR